MRKQDIGPLAEAIDERCRQERKQERDALSAALVQEYADVLARRGMWRFTGGQGTQIARATEDGARAALLCVAERLGVSDLHDQARRLISATIEPALDQRRGDGERQHH